MSNAIPQEGPFEAQHEAIMPALEEHTGEIVEETIEFKGPFTVQHETLGAIVKDADGAIIGHLVDVPGCPAYDLGVTLMRVINDEADRMTQAMLALWELGNTIGELQQAEEHLPADQKSPALARIAAQWQADAYPLIADDLTFQITEEGEVLAKTLVDEGDIPQ